MPPINRLLTLKRSAIDWCVDPSLRIARILGMSDSSNLEPGTVLPTQERRTLFLCNSFSLRVQYSRFESLLSVLIPFKWLASWRDGRWPTKARSTKEWIEIVLREPPVRLTMRYPPRAATCGMNNLSGSLRPMRETRCFRKTLPKSLTAYLPLNPGISFQFSMKLLEQ